MKVGEPRDDQESPGARSRMGVPRLLKRFRRVDVWPTFFVPGVTAGCDPA
jgi:hypothetical protein